MNNKIDFETPENVKISYQVAGTGTRFLAWFLDNIFLTIFCLVLLFLFSLVGASLDTVFEHFVEPEDRANDIKGLNELPMIFFGLWMMVWSLGGFFYFGLSELFLRGQTIGKRILKIRVVKANGFSLSPNSILIRSLFRIIDQLPPLWVVPVLSATSQRFGDMVAETIVISDEVAEISSIREVLGKKTAAESTFRFTVAMLTRSRQEDFFAIESLLERWSSLSAAEQRLLTEKIVPPLAQRLQSEIPSAENYPVFLEDLLAAEYRRRSRKLG